MAYSRSSVSEITSLLTVLGAFAAFSEFRRRAALTIAFSLPNAIIRQGGRPPLRVFTMADRPAAGHSTHLAAPMKGNTGTYSSYGDPRTCRRGRPCSVWVSVHQPKTI